VGLFSSTQPSPTHQITDPTNPYPTDESPYIEQQLACRKKISLCTSCHHHHPNTHRNNANTHSITSITVILGLFQTDEAVMHQIQVFTKRICQSILDTKLHIYMTCIFFAHVSFQTHDPTQPTKNTNFRPIPDPTQPEGQPNPWTTLR